MNVQAVLTTRDVERIAYHATGIFTGETGSVVYQLQENISFYTGSERYSWVDRIQGWGTGAIDNPTRKIAMKVYAA